jgi:hypothetical protein
VDSLLYFVKNTEQLAGTLCHEVSHTIHKDGVELMAKVEQNQAARDRGGAEINEIPCIFTSAKQGK